MNKCCRQGPQIRLSRNYFTVVIKVYCTLKIEKIGQSQNIFHL